MKYSQYMQSAKKILENAKNKTFSIEERRQQAIELAVFMLKEARRIQTSQEYRTQLQISRMMEDPLGKIFTSSLTDECFRTQNPRKVVDQILFLLHKFGVPKYLTYVRQLQLSSFKYLAIIFPSFAAALVRYLIRKETARVILPGEKRPLSRYMHLRRKEGVRVNLNHLGEAILGEKEAENRLKIYLEDLRNPEVEYISVKISTICSQIHLLAWEETLIVLQKRLQELYRAAMHHTFVRVDGERVPKFVNLDMEEYRDLHLTVELFCRVLEESEFFHFSAGIVLQAYLPDSYLIQQELTVWAMKRVANGGAPIKIRLVKGANLAMEKVEASIKGWPQAPYTSKADVDANYKRMLHYACQIDHAKAAHVGVGSHNLFDIAYAMLLRKEMGTEKYVEFEMLEGMADHMRRVVQMLTGDILLYCPSATKEEFVNAVAYLVRRLDENTAPDNFLRHLFGLIPGTKEWQTQANQFSLACLAAGSVSRSPRRTQNRFQASKEEPLNAPFQNEPDTDWALPQNRKWIEKIVKHWKEKKLENIPLVIDGKEIGPDPHYFGTGFDPSRPGVELYRFALASNALADKALLSAERAYFKWTKTSVKERSFLLYKIAHQLRLNRGELIGAMIADGGKIVEEADAEVSEAIDFVEYYRREMERLETLDGISWKSKGVVFVVPPWNFPCAIPMGGIAAALASGNSVLFKPAPETAYVGWKLAQICWSAGIDREVLQFISCEEDSVGSQIIQDRRVASVLLTGATSTAKLMLKLRPGLDLIAETGGKNTMIISAMSDRDLAIRDLVYSAFRHAGQKCSACSLAILEKEVYEDRHFLEALRDAAASLSVGSAWNFLTKVNPLIREPSEALLRGLTTLEEGESWLLEPKCDPVNPKLWSPGIKLGVLPGSFTHQTELFGPILGLMCAKNLSHALELANGTLYGLTAGIHTLDEREKKLWLEKIEAGNCYINRGITGAIVRRQPFGGCKESSFGLGAKAGGPHYVRQLLEPVYLSLPKEKGEPAHAIQLLSIFVSAKGFTHEQEEIWKASIGSYAYHWKETFLKKVDCSLVLGQDNYLSYTPHPEVVFRVHRQDDILDIFRVIAAAMTCGTPLIVSGEKEILEPFIEADWQQWDAGVKFVEESEAELCDRLLQGGIRRMRMLSSPGLKLKQLLAETACNVILTPVSAHGWVELFNYIREISVSSDYHRYGNLGEREMDPSLEV